MRTAIFSIGGSLGAITAGQYYKRLLEVDSDYEIYAGISSGAVNALMLSSMKDRSESSARSYWSSLQNKSIYKSQNPISILMNASLYDTSPLRELISTVEPNPYTDIYVGYTEFPRMIYSEAPLGADYVNQVMSSCAIPFLFKPQPVYGSGIYLDGGIQNMIPYEFLSRYHRKVHYYESGSGSSESFNSFLAGPLDIFIAQPLESNSKNVYGQYIRAKLMDTGYKINLFNSLTNLLKAYPFPNKINVTYVPYLDGIYDPLEFKYGQELFDIGRYHSRTVSLSEYMELLNA